MTSTLGGEPGPRPFSRGREGRGQSRHPLWLGRHQLRRVGRDNPSLTRGTDRRNRRVSCKGTPGEKLPEVSPPGPQARGNVLATRNRKWLRGQELPVCGNS